MAHLVAPQGARAQITAINKHGDMVANVETDLTAAPFVVTSNGVVPILVPPSFGPTVAVDIADNGAVLLVAEASSGSPRTLIWRSRSVVPFSDVAPGWGTAINARGQVVYRGAGGGFLWDAGVSTALSTAQGRVLEPVGLNNAGQVLGVQGDLEGAFLWSQGSSTQLPFFDGVSLDDAGRVSGYFRDAASGPGVLNDINVGVYEAGVLVPFDSGRAWPTWDRDREAHLFGMNEAGELVGEMPPVEGANPVPFLRDATGKTHLLPTPAAGSANGVSESGIVVGEVHDVATGGAFVDVRSTIWSPQCFGACCR
jgi:hypothetical protein